MRPSTIQFLAAAVLATLQLNGADNATIAGGENREFKTLLSDFPAAQVSDGATDDDTPGSTNWYARVDAITVPDHWTVWSNGVPVEIGVTNADLEPKIVYAKGFGDLDIGVVTADGVTNAYHANQFYAKWGTAFYAIATNSTEFDCLEHYGHPLYWMKAHKLDEGLYGAYFASYSAYFERLLFGSASDQIDMDDSSIISDLELDPRYYFVRTGMTNDYHRLLEYGNITNFMEKAGEMRSNLEIEIPVGAYTDPHHPAFIFFNGGLLDNDCDYGLPAHLYWASTRTPPRVRQKTGDHAGDWTYPSEEEINQNSLLPKFDWREDAIAFRRDPQDLLWIESQFWQVYAMTLSSISGGDNPIKHLFETVGYNPSAGPLDQIKSYRGGGLYGLLTNTYHFAAMAFTNPEANEAAYGRCFGQDAISMKVLPGAFVGANHTFGVMDRLVYIPSVNMLFANDLRTRYNECTFVADKEYTFAVRWSREHQKYFIDELHDETFESVIDDRNTGYEDQGTVQGEWMVLSVGPVSCGVPEDASQVPGNATASIFLSEFDVENIFEDSGAEDFFRIYSLVPNGGELVVRYNPDGQEDVSYSYYLDAHGLSGEVTIRPRVFVRASYSTVEPTINPWVYATGRDLPCSGNRVTDNSVAYLDRRDLKYTLSGTTDEYVTAYKSDGTEGISTDWDDSRTTHFASLVSDMQDDVVDRVGNIFAPELFARLPDRPQFKINAGSFEVDGEGAISPIQMAYNHYEPTHYCRMPYDHEATFVTTNEMYETHYSDFTTYYVVSETRIDTEEGWVLTEAVTNFVGATDYPDYLIETVTNSSATCYESAKTNWEYVTVIDRNMDELAFEYSYDLTTNRFDVTTEIRTDYLHDIFCVTNIHVYVDGSATTNITVDSRDYTYVATNDYSRIEEDTWSSPVRVELTGREVIDRSSHVWETGEISECGLMIDVYRDYTYRMFYTDPYDPTHEIVTVEGLVPIVLGTFHAAVMSDGGGTYEFVPPPTLFEGEYENKVRFAPIESAAYGWKSMTRSDISE